VIRIGEAERGERAPVDGRETVGRADEGERGGVRRGHGGFVIIPREGVTLFFLGALERVARGAMRFERPIGREETERGGRVVT